MAAQALGIHRKSHQQGAHWHGQLYTIKEGTATDGDEQMQVFAGTGKGQGLLMGTTSSTDISVNGNGFFITNEAETPDGAIDNYLMTRAGSFVPNENGRLVNTAGLY